MTQTADLRAALDEAVQLVVGAGNGTWTRQRPIEEWQRLYRLFSDARATLEAEPPATGLDVAWQRAEAALPEGWRVGELKATTYRGRGERWLAMAWEFTDDPDYLTFRHGNGDTAIEALQALATLLREAGK